MYQNQKNTDRIVLEGFLITYMNISDNKLIKEKNFAPTNHCNFTVLCLYNTDIIPINLLHVKDRTDNLHKHYCLPKNGKKK